MKWEMVAHNKRKREKEGKMVTVASFLVFILLTSLLLVIDITTYHYSLMEAWRILFQSDLLIGRLILYGTCAVGFISAIIIDIRILKKKRKKQTI
jgi:hypothetical protein